MTSAFPSSVTCWLGSDVPYRLLESLGLLPTSHLPILPPRNRFHHQISVGAPYFFSPVATYTPIMPIFSSSQPSHNVSSQSCSRALLQSRSPTYLLTSPPLRSRRRNHYSHPRSLQTRPHSSLHNHHTPRNTSPAHRFYTIRT